MNSECRIPIENDGAFGFVAYTFSGLCAPGPGFNVESVRKSKNYCNELSHYRDIKFHKTKMSLKTE